jgi:cytochrome c peroxidase
MRPLQTLSSALVVALAVTGCAPRTPTTIAVGQSLPELSFLDAEGASTSLSAYTEAGKASPHVLAVRLVAGWCGTCQWHAANTRSMLPDVLEQRVRVLDVVLAGEDNGPPVSADATAWAARGDRVATVVTDSTFQLAPLFPARAALPLIALVDTRTMTPTLVLSNPGPEVFTDALRAAVAKVDGASPPVSTTPSLADGRFTRDAWELIQAMALTTPSTDPSNAYESDVAAIALGKTLFFDGDLSSSSKKVSCGACHPPELLFQDGKDQAPEGVTSGSRNVPSVILAADQRSLFWDGRADSPWSQAIMPIEDPSEMGSSRLFVAHVIAAKYRAPYEAIFGALPPLEESGRFPAAGKPGDAAWEAMAAADRALVNRLFANVGKALAAYEHSLRPLPNALDRYAQGQLEALTEAEKDGLAAYFAAGCAQCHYGPRLTDDSFHALRFPTGRPDRAADRGRVDGIPKLLASEFLRSGAFSDAPSAPVVPATGPGLLGAFKTPGLRGVPFTLPYGHGGCFGGLTSTLDAHRTGGVAADSPSTVGTAEPWLVEFDAASTTAIIAFLKTLRADVAP